MINVETRENRLFVYTPFSREFVNDIKASVNGARWNPSEKAWTVPVEAEETVYALLANHYGYRKDSNDITIIITALKRLVGEQDSVRFAGIPVARATGRDSGARVCENVIHIEGSFGSGGSVKNWTTEVKEGSRFKLMDIPESVLENVDRERWEFTIVEEKSAKEKLIERKKALLEELALIEEQIVNMD